MLVPVTNSRKVPVAWVHYTLIIVLVFEMFESMNSNFECRAI